MSEPITLTERERAVFKEFSRRLRIAGQRFISGDGDLNLPRVIDEWAESASPPRAPGASAHPLKVGVESGPGQPIPPHVPDVADALVEKAALAICANDEDNQECDPPLICTYSCVACRNMARPAILSLGIPAAALNALAKGEAVVVPKEPNAAIVQAGYYAVGVLYRAMLAASPYAEE